MAYSFLQKYQASLKGCFLLKELEQKTKFFFNIWVFKNISTSRLLLTTSAKLEFGNAYSSSFKSTGSPILHDEQG